MRNHFILCPRFKVATDRAFLFSRLAILRSRAIAQRVARSVSTWPHPRDKPRAFRMLGFQRYRFALSALIHLPSRLGLGFSEGRIRKSKRAWDWLAVGV